MDVARALTPILKERFNLDSFRQGQIEILASVVSGNDTIAIMPTGGGKSLCFQLPALHLKGITIVISPLVSLMRDQVEALKSLGIGAACLYANQDLDEKREVFRAMDEAESFILYLSPERVQKPGFIKWFKRANVSLVAIDEAHCVSKWGADFRQDYYKLNMIREIRPDISLLVLTATATPEVLSDVTKRLDLKDPDKHIYGFYRPNLFFQVEFCDSPDDKEYLLLNAIDQVPTGKILIYAGTRKRCENLYHLLKRTIPNVSYYHAGLPQDSRRTIEAQFQSSESRVLIATNAFGMGIDHADIRLVVHDQIPGSLEAYYQEIGRAGRDGKPASCLLFYSKKDKGLQSYFLKQADAESDVLSSRWQALDAMLAYAELGNCRHRHILDYFGDKQGFQSCGHCDVCDVSHESYLSWTSYPRKVSQKRVRKDKLRKPLTSDQSEKAEAIQQWCRAKAKRVGMPAFTIMSRKVVENVVKVDPKTVEELKRVKGIGPRKVDDFGYELLGLLETLREAKNLQASQEAAI